MRCVELLGGGLTKGNVPAFHPSAERWSLNRVMFTRYAGVFDHWTRWFDLHPTDYIRRVRPDAYDWYCEQTKPIMRWERDPNMVSMVYPRQAVQRFFADGTDEREFSGTLSWMMALAIFEGFDAIDLFWFTLDGTDPFYKIQIDSAKYWIGQARGRGVHVTVHGDSSLHPQPYLYGCEIIDGVRVDAVNA